MQRNRIEDKNGDKDQYRAAKYKLRTTIRKAKLSYGTKLEQQFSSSNARSLWKNLKDMTDYKKRLTSRPASLPDRLNKSMQGLKNPPHQPSPLTQLQHHSSASKEDEVRATFKKLNIMKAAGPDEISPALLSHCGVQLAPGFSTVFNTSLSQYTVPVFQMPHHQSCGKVLKDHLTQ